MPETEPLAETESNTGSPSPGGPEFLVVGRLRRPHGMRGEILMEVITDFPERLRIGTRVFVGDDYQPARIRTRRQHQNALLVSFHGVTDQETAAAWRNTLVYVRAGDRPPLPEGEYYHHQILGLRVVDEDGALLGTLTQILDYSAHDIYVVLPETGPEILLPATEEVILDISLEKGEVRVHLLPGLLPE